jgi:hypothetical protein
MAVSGDFWWPSVGIFVAAVVEIFVAADTHHVRSAVDLTGIFRPWARRTPGDRMTEPVLKPFRPCAQQTRACVRESRKRGRVSN